MLDTLNTLPPSITRFSSRDPTKLIKSSKWPPGAIRTPRYARSVAASAEDGEGCAQEVLPGPLHPRRVIQAPYLPRVRPWSTSVVSFPLIFSSSMKHFRRRLLVRCDNVWICPATSSNLDVESGFQSVEWRCLVASKRQY